MMIWLAWKHLTHAASSVTIVKGPIQADCYCSLASLE